MLSLLKPTQMCWICGTAVLESHIKTDEHGNRVHGKCLRARASQAKQFEIGKKHPGRVGNPFRDAESTSKTSQQL
jgi:hypothetical protein